MKRQYISPSIYTRKVVFHSSLAQLSSAGVTSNGEEHTASSQETSTTIDGTNYGGNGNGLSKGGWFDDDESIW